jgi:hypothetical protein
MKKLLVSGLLSTGLLFTGVGPAVAAGNTQSGPTVGDCISDGIYGNEPNIVDGHVVPSQSPGPKMTNQTTGEVTDGSSVGDFNQAYGPGIIPELCRDATAG